MARTSAVRTCVLGVRVPPENELSNIPTDSTRSEIFVNPYMPGTSMWSGQINKKPHLSVVALAAARPSIDQTLANSLDKARGRPCVGACSMEIRQQSTTVVN